MSYTCNHTKRGPNGAKGTTGKLVNGNSSNGVQGVIGLKKEETLILKQQLTGFSFSYFKMLLHEVELDYLNERRTEASQKLMWMEGILSSGNELTNESVDIAMSENAIQQNEVYTQVLLERVQALLIQLSQGLDFYGNFQNFVPLTSISIYEASIDQMLLLSKDIEEAYNTYYDKKQDAASKRNAIVNAVDSIESQKDNLLLSKEQIVKEVGQTKEQIAEMLGEIIVLEQRVRYAKEEFESAVSREAACGLSDVLQAASAIALVASGIGTVAGGLAMLSETNNYVQKQKVKERFKEKAKYISKHSKTVSGGFDDISKGYQSVKGMLDADRDGAKIIAAQEDFEAAVSKFEHLPEAREYRKLMRQLLSLYRVRNGKILEVDSKITRILEMEIEAEELGLDIQTTRFRLLTVFNPRLAEHVMFFERATSMAKTALLRAIIMEHKALQYWGLTRSLVPKNLQDRSIAQLSSFHLSFKDKHLRLIEERNAIPQPIHPKKMMLKRELLEDVYAVFDEIGRFSFELSTTNPSYRFYARVLVNSVEINIETEEPMTGWAWAFMRHNGQSTFVDQLGKLHKYSHRRRDRVGEIHPGSNSVTLPLGGEIGKYAFLSPFTNWTFRMEFANEEGELLTGIDEIAARKNVKNITVRFKGVADTRYGEFANVDNTDDGSMDFAPPQISFS